MDYSASSIALLSFSKKSKMGMDVECSFFGAILIFIQSSNIKFAQIIKQSVIY